MTSIESDALSVKTARLSVVATWVVAAVGAVLASILPPEGSQLRWFAIVLAVALLMSFCVQLALASREGFVDRVMASVGGSIVILAIATGAVAIWGLG